MQLYLWLKMTGIHLNCFSKHIILKLCHCVIVESQHVASKCHKLFERRPQQFAFTLHRGVAHIVVHGACACVHACMSQKCFHSRRALSLPPNKSTRHPLMITTHHQHSMSPSWSTLFPPTIPLEDYSLLPRLHGYQARAILTGQTSNIVFLGLFTHWQKKKRRRKEKKKNEKTFYPCVKSIRLPQWSCWYTVKAGSPSSLFCSLEGFWMWLVCRQGGDW